MATNFPTSLDALTNPLGTDTLASPDHAGQHANANDAIEALQTKVGVNSSAVTASLDYKIAQAATLTGVQTLTNKQLTAPEETWNIVASASAGALNFDVVTAGTWFYTSVASANWTLNFRGDASTTLNSLLAVSASVTVAFAAQIGTSAYYPTAFTIDGTAVTPKWQGGTAPSSGNASSIDVYVFTIIKTAGTPTYTVLASQTKFA